MNMNGMNFESKLQDLGRRLVDREIYYCVSSLVSTLSALVQNVSYEVQRAEGISEEEDVYPLLESIDYEEAVRQYVMDDADLGDLEALIENDGDWKDFVLESMGYDFDAPPLDEQGDEIDLEKWLELEGLRSHLCEAVFEFLEKNSDMEELCHEFNIDTDDHHSEVYEHWIVSDWLAGELKARGETVGELCGMTIWGRGCTGQSICLDHVIQQVAAELWPEELE